MPNMSYCRFENTLAAIEDCAEALSEKGIDGLSRTERSAALRLIVLCGEINDENRHILLDVDQDEARAAGA